MELHARQYFRSMSLMGKRIGVYLLCLMLTSGFSQSERFLFAFINKRLFNAVEYQKFDLLLQAVILAGLLFLLDLVLIPVLGAWFDSTMARISHEVRMLAFNHTLRLPVRFFERTHSGNVLSRLTNDIEAMQKAYREHTPGVLHTVLGGIGSAVIMFLLDWRLSMFVIVISAASSVLNIAFTRPLRRLGDRIQDSLGKATECISDVIAGIRVLKIFGLRDVVVGRFLHENAAIVQDSFARARKQALLISLNFTLSITVFVCVLSVGALMVSRQTVDLGTVMAIITLQSGITAVFQSIGYFFVELQESMPGAVRLFELMEEEPEPERYTMATERADRVNEGMIVLDGVHFSYGEQAALNGISLVAKRGGVTAIVGESGSGKSTVFKLLMGFYEPHRGAIAIDEKWLGEYTLRELRGKMAYVSQEAFVFDGTVYENISCGGVTASEAEVYSAAQAAFAHGFIEQMPEGYQTPVGERGVKLSGGQRQRIAIARAFLKDAPVLLLDEATSALDSESERLVQLALSGLMKGRTVLAIAHRISTVKDAGMVYVLDGGRVIEEGTHAQLYAKKSAYYALYTHRFTDIVANDRA